MLPVSPFPFFKFFIACCCSYILFAQPTQVTVLCVSGSANQTSISAHLTIPLKAGQKIPTHASISVGNASYVALTSINGSLIELNKEGTYPVKSLMKRKPVIKNVLQKYITLATRELLKKSGSKVPGAVTGSDSSQCPSPIYIDFPGDSYILDSTVQFTWYRNKRCFRYTIKLFNEDDTPLMRESTVDTFLTVNLTKAGVDYENPVHVCVNSSADANIVSDVVYLIRFDNKRSAAIRKELHLLLADANTNSPIHCLAIGLYLESKKLIADAYRYLLKAVLLLPEDRPMQQTVFDFRERHFIFQP